MNNLRLLLILIQHCRDTFKTFDGCYEYLRSVASKKNAQNDILSTFHVNLTSQNLQPKDDYSIEHMILYCEQSGIDPTPDNLRFINQTMRDPGLFNSLQSMEVITGSRGGPYKICREKTNTYFQQ